ncbi:MAG: tryptophan--tRNA ligase [Elusimicrobiota bacterium]
MTAAKRLFSGIQPTSVPHLGNYLGALKHWVTLQSDYQCLYCVVDLHALTTARNPKETTANIFDTASMLLAIGVDVERSVLFVQSQVSGHAELAWILSCFCYMGELGRMTQFKEKVGAEQEAANAGLFTYPVLMSADILLYNTRAVPVGDDQKQHLELARTIARRFNNAYEAVFSIPEPIIPAHGARIMSLDDPGKKMSKSAASAMSFVALTDEPDAIRKKIRSAVTDSGREVIYDETAKPALANLLTIMSLVCAKTPQELSALYRDKGYAVFKSDLAEAVITFLMPVQERYRHWKDSPDKVNALLAQGAERARVMAAPMLERVKGCIGIKM